MIKPENVRSSNDIFIKYTILLFKEYETVLRSYYVINFIGHSGPRKASTAFHFQHRIFVRES